MVHAFTSVILGILAEDFPKDSADIYEKSDLLQYLNIKTKAASRGSKSRSSFGQIYAIYVLVEDYIEKGFVESGKYSQYEGARFSPLFRRQRELPFGSKLQNHHLNHRLNEEFHKFFPISEYHPIQREVETQKYWFNENLLKARVGSQEFNIARSVIRIIIAYIEAKKNAFEGFIKDCERMVTLEKKKSQEVREFIMGCLRPDVDARVFEIVSYAILKAYYGSQSVFWGWKQGEVQEEYLLLYKTGRCNANDGGIDFVMKPLGRFFQVTETLNVAKYFLDIDKIARYPLTFVVKTNESGDFVRDKIQAAAAKLYSVSRIVARYMACIEEIINIPDLLKRFDQVQEQRKLRDVIREIVVQSKVEFNYEEE